jgi:hypothetical protein
VRVRHLIVVWLEEDTWVISKSGAKRREKGNVEWVGKEIWALLGFVALVCVLVHF